MKPRVFFPGDHIPIGTWVMGPDRTLEHVWAEDATVDTADLNPAGWNPKPLVEVLLPDYAAVVAEAERGRSA